MVEKDVVVRNLLKSGQKLQATNLYHQCYGGKLAEVRAIIEAMETDDGVTGYYPGYYRWEEISDRSFRDIAEETLRQGRLLQTIRMCREHFPGALKYAKQAVLAWQTNLGINHGLQDSEQQAPVQTFDIRWHHILHKQKKSLFSKPTASRIEFRFELQIAENTIPDMDDGAVSWLELAASKTIDGEFEIFTCSCGDMGCGGFSAVEVIHLDNRTLWYDQWKWHIFDAAHYRTAINRVEEALQELAVSYPSIPIEFELSIN